jgi:protein-tyrosine phosphatase
MLDMHCHLLPGVDDGCDTFEQSIEMIKKAISVGITDIIITPHYAPLRGYVVASNLIKDRFDELLDVVKKERLNINLYLGREIDEIEDIEVLLNNGEIETLNNTKFVLIDFGMQKADIDEYCYGLIINGYKPIIAHPERYNYVSSTDDYHQWKKTGALIQINATSLLKSRNKKTRANAKYLLKNGLVDFIASDCHGFVKQYDSFKEVNDLVIKKYKNIKINSNFDKLI